MFCDIHHGFYGASLESRLKYVTEMPSLQKAISVTTPWILCCDFEVFEIICWSNRMISSCTKWWLSCQELPDFDNLDLCFYFLSTVCTYWSFHAFLKSKVTAVTHITERCFCFWLSDYNHLNCSEQHFENTFHKVKLMFSFPSKLIIYVVNKAWMGICFFLMAVYFCHQICFTSVAFSVK